MDKLFFAGWDSIFRTLIVGTCAYVALVLLLRISGNRTLSKMNSFDLIVTVALGSTLASVLLTKSIPLADGVAAFLLLVALQFAVTWTSVRVHWVRTFVTGEPRLLLYQGACLPKELRRARVRKDEIEAVLRSAGIPSFAEAEAVVLETDGSFSAIRRRPDEEPLKNLVGVRTPAAS